MKICTSLVFLIILFSACKKDQPVSGENHLVKIIYTDGSATSKEEFEYDPSGRLIKKTFTQDGIGTGIQNEINYTGNQVAITYPDQPSFFQKDTRYQLDAQNRPVKRFFSHLETFSSSLFGPERHFGADTTNYEYDGNGYLNRYTGISKDSVSYYPSAGV